MKLLTLTSIVLMGLVINNAIRRSNARSKKAMDEFWERERSSFKAPSRSVSDLEYITFPDDLPLNISTDDPQIKEYQETLVNITKNKVLDLSGISNTDIRMAYGSKNMEELSRADQRYTTLCRSLNSLSKAYMRTGHSAEALTLLRFAISCGSDIKESWMLLGQYHMDRDEREEMDKLIEKASALPEDSHTKRDILKELRELKGLMEIVS